MDMFRQRSEEHATGGMLAPLTVRAGRSTVAAREKIGLAALAIERARRGTLARMRRSRLLRWRHRAPIADDLLLAPPDVRPQDPSFADEIEAGGFGLCGFTVQLRGRSPFIVPSPSETWTRELHGFGWLRHFGAGWSLENEMVARRLVAEWIAGKRRHTAHAWAPEVVSRRIISWLSHAGLILNGAERRPYAAVMLSLEDQVTYLSATWRDALLGYPRMLALIGLAQTGLCIAGHERRLNLAERPLVDELDRQILSDGGHVSRNPWIGVELLLDLLPLKQCFIARGLPPDPALPAAIDRMIAWLHRLRLGDGQLARFNGMGPTERDALATVFAYDKVGPQPCEAISPSGYVRMERGATVVLADAGTPPALELAGHACAGCLSFEMSTGRELLLVNGGMPASAHEQHRAAARGTTSHNTLELNGQSSARLMRDEGLERGVGSAPIQHPDHVTCAVTEAEGSITLTAEHDGYADRFNLVHSRTLILDAAGGRLDGTDRLDGTKGDLRLSWDIPFAVHFHLHPRSGARINPDGSALLVLPSGTCWRLSASGAALTIEESTHYAEVIGPLQAQQVVLRAACYGAAEVHWVLEQVTRQTGSQSTSEDGKEPAKATEATEADEGAAATASAPDSGGEPA